MEDHLTQRPQLTVVTPMFNEREVLPLFVTQLRQALQSAPGDYEIVAVDDGSTDDTAVYLQRYLREWPELRVVRLRANSGHQAAISAGLARARGEWVVTIDADLQDPPAVILEMLQVGIQEQVDVVYGVRADRQSDTRFKRTTATMFYRSIRRLSDLDAPIGAGDFRLMSRATVDAINALPEHNRVLRLAVPALGFPAASVHYRRDERAAGESKYPLSKMLRLTLDSVVGFSHAPLRLATWLGTGGFVFAAAMLIYALVQKVLGHTVSGWTSTVVVVAAFSAVQLLCLGILGEYVGRIWRGQQRRAEYYVAYDSLHETAGD